MKRDMDLVRDILLAIEANSFPDLNKLLKFLNTGQRSFDDPVCHHIKMLVDEVGFISAEEFKSYGGPNWLRIELTWQGHEFLDSVRDIEVWKAAKSGAEAAGGFSIDLLKALAKGLLRKKIEQHTGVELDI